MEPSLPRPSLPASSARPTLPPSPRPSTSPRPKKKFSLRGIRARFASTSNVNVGEELTAASEWSKLYPRRSPVETFNPYDLSHPHSPYGASSESSHTGSSQTSPREKILPPVPPAPLTSPHNGTSSPNGLAQPNGDSTHPPADHSDLPWVSRFQTRDYVPLTDGHTRQNNTQITTSVPLVSSVGEHPSSVNARGLTNRSLSISP